MFLPRLLLLSLVFRHTTQAFTTPSRRPERIHSLIVLRGKDWDAIVAADEDDGNANVPRDMQYNERNCERSARNYQAIRAAGGDTADIYGCCAMTNNDNDNDAAVTFWYLGKVAWVSGVSQAACVQRQWNLIQHHAANLRPLELFATASAGDMAVWCAPGDSELDVAYQRPQIASMERIVRPPPPLVEEKIPNTFVGFQGEVYEGGEEGFRVWRRASDGGPGRPEIEGPAPDDAAATSSSAETPTDEQMERLQEALQGKDINEIYEEQERRRREAESTN